MQQNIQPYQPADNNTDITASTSRRQFVFNLARVAGSAALLSTPFVNKAAIFTQTKTPYTVGEVMDLFIKEVPGAPFTNTVDTLKSGSRDIVVTGIVTTMFATIAVIKNAIELKANFIIAHEPAFYNHEDATDWLQNDAVYSYKAALLKQHNIAVWRNHDYVHSLANDGVRTGVLNKLGWQKFDKGKGENIVLDTATNLKMLIEQLKQRLGISLVRYIGDLSQTCQNILLMPGAAGGKRQIEGIIKNKPDVLVCGEVQEWETPEYVRDARANGQQISMVVLGHIASEEPGSEFMVNWLHTKIPGITSTHIPATNSLYFL